MIHAINKKKTANKVKEPIVSKADKATQKPAEKKIKPFFARVTTAANFILQQKFTDEEIIVKVDEKFPDYPGSPVKFTQAEMNRTRWVLRFVVEFKTKQLKKNQPIARLFKTEEGNLVERSELPKKARATKKVKKEEDPLNNIAGVNVHDDSKKKTIGAPQLLKEAIRKTEKKESKAEALKKKIKKSKQ